MRGTLHRGPDHRHLLPVPSLHSVRTQRLPQHSKVALRRTRCSADEERSHAPGYLALLPTLNHQRTVAYREERGLSFEVTRQESNLHFRGMGRVPTPDVLSVGPRIRIQSALSPTIGSSYESNEPASTTVANDSIFSLRAQVGSR